MVVNKKPTGRASSMAGGLMAGTLAGMTATLGLAAAAAKLIENGIMEESSIGYWAMGILALSSFSSAIIACEKIKRRRLLVCVLSGVIYFAMLISMAGLFFGGQYSGIGVTGLMILCGAVLAILIGLRGERGGKSRKSPGHYR